MNLRRIFNPWSLLRQAEAANADLVRRNARMSNRITELADAFHRGEAAVAAMQRDHRHLMTIPDRTVVCFPVAPVMVRRYEPFPENSEIDVHIERRRLQQFGVTVAAVLHPEADGLDRPAIKAILRLAVCQRIGDAVDAMLDKQEPTP